MTVYRIQARRTLQEIRFNFDHPIWPKGIHYVTLPDGSPLPRKIPVGAIFLWNGQMWRKGVGILYRARPGSGIVAREHRRREARRWKQRRKDIKGGRYVHR